MSESKRYAQAGVEYTTLDAAKRLALEAARASLASAAERGGSVVADSLGEPATVLAFGSLRLGFVLECLGTKSMLARAYEEATGTDAFAAIGYDTVCAAVNDLVCVGALPLVVNAYFATGAASFYAGTRHASLVEGFGRACAEAGAAWGGGESPTLAGLVAPSEIDLAAAAVGLVPEGVEPLLGEALVSGDEIVLVASTGIHANGASLVRALVPELADGLTTALPSGMSLGEAVLAPSALYVDLVEAALRESLPLHYVSHITGHGLRKVMRANRRLTYRLRELPPVPEVLAFVVERTRMEPREAYATFNMGAGLACVVAAGSGGRLVELARARGHGALVAGVVEDGERRVVLESVGVEFVGTDLALR